MIRSYSSLLFWLGMVIMASIMLYHTSDRVTGLERRLKTLNAQIENEQESLHVLRAEWVYLANPARIEAAAQRYLNLQPTAPRRIAAAQHMNLLLPAQSGAPVLPTQMAQNTVSPSQVLDAAPAPRAARVGRAAAHINDHMVMQHTAAVASGDKIGAMISSLGLHP